MLGAFVEPKHRTLTELEKKRLEKTKKAHELKEIRRVAFNKHQVRFESVLRAKERLNSSPERVKNKRKIIVDANNALAKVRKTSKKTN